MAYALEGPVWPAKIITWSFATSTLPADSDLPFTDYISAASLQSQVETALAAWQAVSGIHLVEVADSANSDIRIGLASFTHNGSGEIGETDYNYYLNTSTAEAFIPDTLVRIEDPAYLPFDPGGSGLNDVYEGTGSTFYQVALHEIGHSLGMGHDTVDADAVMYPVATAQNRSLSASDIAGIQALYGPAPLQDVQSTYDAADTTAIAYAVLGDLASQQAALGSVNWSGGALAPASSSSLVTITTGGSLALGDNDLGAIVDATVPVTLQGGAGLPETIAAGIGGLSFTAGAASGFLAVAGGNDLFNGGASAWLISFGGGSGTINGGTGALAVDTNGAPVTIYGGQGPVAVDAGLATLVVYAGAGSVSVGAGTGSETVWAGSGGGSVAGGSAGDNVLVATGGRTTLAAGGAGDALTALGGNATLDGAGGQETLGGAGDAGALSIQGGSGRDLLVAGGGPTTITAGAPSAMFGGSGAVQAYGNGQGGDLFVGGSGDALFLGQGAGNTVFGGGGPLTVYGGPGGSDVMVVSGQALVTSQGPDDLVYLTGTQAGGSVFGNAGAIIDASGSGGAATLTGGAGAQIYAGSGADCVAAGAGNATLFAGSGNDTLIGGSGADVFAFAAGHAGGSDVIDGFDASQDYLVLSLYGSMAYTQTATPAGAQLVLRDGTRILLAGVASVGADRVLV